MTELLCLNPVALAGRPNCCSHGRGGAGCGEAFDERHHSNEPVPPHAGVPPTHFAFAIAAEDVEGWTAKLEAEGMAVESVVTWPRGAMSVYFRDPDGNLAELITPGFWATY